MITGNLGLPTQASSDKVRQLVEGKSQEMGHQPSNVQVVVREQIQKSTRIYLVNESGTIQDFEHCDPDWLQKEMKEKDDTICE